MTHLGTSARWDALIAWAYLLVIADLCHKAVDSEDGHFLSHIGALSFDDAATISSGQHFRATRLDPDHPWVRLTLQSMQATTGKVPSLLTTCAQRGH